MVCCSVPKKIHPNGKLNSRAHRRNAHSGHTENGSDDRTRTGISWAWYSSGPARRPLETQGSILLSYIAYRDCLALFGKTLQGLDQPTEIETPDGWAVTECFGP